MGEHNHDHEHCGHDHGTDDPKTYTKAGWIGVGGFLFEGVTGFALAGSVGAVGDALHALTDAASFFLSARHARLEGEILRRDIDYEKRSVVMQTAFLLLAIVLVAGNLALGNRLVELSSLNMFFAAILGLAFNLWQMNVLGASRREGMNRHEAARQHAFIDVLFSVVVIHGAILNFFIKLDGWMSAKIAAVLGLVLLVSVAFVIAGFVDFEGFLEHKKAGYVLASVTGAALSIFLVVHGSERAVDRCVGLFLLFAMVASLSINLFALARWERGGRQWVHVH